MVCLSVNGNILLHTLLATGVKIVTLSLLFGITPGFKIKFMRTLGFKIPVRSERDSLLKRQLIS